MDVVLWLIVAFAAGAVEAATVSLVSIWLALGAVCAAVSAAFGASAVVQSIVFLVASLVLLILTAPLSKKFREGKKVPTNADRLIGCDAIITEDIDPINGKGAVKVLGQEWSAQMQDGTTAEKGATVVVEDICGAHLVVKFKEQ